MTIARKKQSRTFTLWLESYLCNVYNRIIKKITNISFKSKQINLFLSPHKSTFNFLTFPHFPVLHQELTWIPSMHRWCTTSFPTDTRLPFSFYSVISLPFQAKRAALLHLPTCTSLWHLQRNYGYCHAVHDVAHFFFFSPREKIFIIPLSVSRKLSFLYVYSINLFIWWFILFYLSIKLMNEILVK